MEEWRYTAKAIVQYNAEDVKNNAVSSYWTSISDIGKRFNGKLLTYEDYIAVENKYIKSAMLIRSEFNNSHLKVSELFKYSDKNSFKSYEKDLLQVYNNLNEGLYKVELFEDIIRLNLREHINCVITLDAVSHTVIRFGYDYYMYVNSNTNLESVFNLIELSIGLNIL